MERTLEAWGWDDRWETLLRESAGAAARPARVTSHHRDRWTLQTADGPRDARLAGPGRGSSTPATGDWVIATAGPYASDPWSIADVLTRRSAVTRGSAGVGPEQILAANVDRLWIVHGLDTEPNPRRLKRYLAVGWESGASPEVVLTKAGPGDRAGGVRTGRARRRSRRPLSGS